MTILPLLALGACAPEPSAGRPDDRGATTPTSPAPAPQPDDEPVAAPEPTPCELRTPGVMCTWMGFEGVALFAQGELPVAETWLNLPLDVAFGPDGLAWVIDYNNHRIVRVDADGIARTVVGVGVIGDGLFDPATGTWNEGPGSDYKINHPTGVAFDPTDPEGVYIAAFHNSRVLRYDLATDWVSHVAGTGARAFAGDGGPALDAAFDLPSSIVFDGTGGYWVSEVANHVLRHVGADGTVATVAGTPRASGYDGDGPALETMLAFPGGRMQDPGGRMSLRGGRVVFPDSANHLVREYDPATGTIATLAGSYVPSATLLDSNGDYVGDVEVGEGGYAGDGGAATSARLNHPLDLAVAPDGTIYVADTRNDCVRVITPDGKIDTFAGQCGVEGMVLPGEPTVAHGLPRRDARLAEPTGVALDAEGNLYIADTYNNVIRVVWAEPAEDPGEISAP